MPPRVIAAAIAAAFVWGAPTPSPAQTWPDRPITMVVPFAPGGPADVLGRLVAQRLGEELQQTIVVENKPGANTIIGAQQVAKAKPDGYTILLAIDGTLVMNPYLYSNLAYDPFKDFDPVALIADVPSSLIANNKVTANTLKEVLDIERSKPGTFQVGVSTPTSQVAVGLMNQYAGTNFSMVQYGGGTTQVTALMAGDIMLGHESVNVSLPLHQDKQLKIIALTGSRRLTNAPELPTFGEMFPGFDMGIWQSVVAPHGTPRPIVERLAAGLAKSMADPGVRQKLLAAGIEPHVSANPEEFAGFIKAQAETRAKVIKALGMKLD